MHAYGYSFLSTKTFLAYLLLSGVGSICGSICGSLLRAGNMPPIEATSTQQCSGCTVRPRMRLPIRRLEGAECSVSFVTPSIVDGLLSSCCDRDASVGCCCRQSLLGLAAWRQNPVFLPYLDGWHGDQARRDWVCWRQLQSQAHSATTKAVVHTVRLAHRTRPQQAVGKRYGLSAHSCRGALT